MNINIHYVELPFSEKITQFIVQTLNNFKDAYPSIVGAEVSLKRIQEIDEVKETCEIELKIPGLSIVVSSMGDKCEKAARKSALEIIKLLQKRRTGI